MIIMGVNYVVAQLAKVDHLGLFSSEQEANDAVKLWKKTAKGTENEKIKVKVMTFHEWTRHVYNLGFDWGVECENAKHTGKEVEDKNHCVNP